MKVEGQAKSAIKRHLKCAKHSRQEQVCARVHVYVFAHVKKQESSTSKLHKVAGDKFGFCFRVVKGGALCLKESKQDEPKRHGWKG